MVSASTLKKDFVKYERDELEKLSPKQCDEYVESLVIEHMKGFKNGMIADNPNLDEINALIDSYMSFAKTKFNNANAVLLNRKLTYLSNAYLTANANSINHFNDLRISSLNYLVIKLTFCKICLYELLNLYFDNYSNYGMLNDLFFKLSTNDDLDVTFEIHEKYLNNEIGVNHDLMKDLDYYIKLKVDLILGLFDEFEKLVNVDDVTADDYFDNIVDGVKGTFKTMLSDRNDFEKTALLNSGLDTALFHAVETAKMEIKIVKLYLEIKDWFMNLYNNNGFADISESRFEYLKEVKPDIFNDFDEFMKKEPKYDLKEFKFIEPEIKRVAF